MNKKVVYFIALVTCLTFSSCNYIAAIIMAKEEKKTIAEWKDEHYKVRLQRRQGWAGPHYFHCKVNKKKFGIYWKIGSETYSREAYSECLIDFITKSDTLKIDICTKKVIYTDSIKPK